jgi:bacillithiol biosynthesis cysteine-adding enzyme BshC
MPTADHVRTVPLAGIPVERLAGATRLYLDFLDSPRKVEEFLGPPFDDRDAARQLARRLENRTYERATMVGALRELADDYRATDRARRNIDLLGDPRSLVVFAGQQVGLFTGPLYTIYKALATERWAASMSEMLDRPVIPCFWLSTDDHDFAEVDHIHMPVGDVLETFRYVPDQAPGGDPMGRVRMTAEIEATIAALADALPDTEFKADVFATLRECYRPGERFASAFGRLWARLFPESGLVPVSPCRRSFKLLAQSLLLRAQTEERQLFELYRKASSALAERGYHQQVHKSADQTFLFFQQFKRHSIHRADDGRYAWEGVEPVDSSWLERQIREHPEHFSPNVLLRPVIQNALFPTLGVTLGPSETAYYAQIGGLHDRFGVPRPLVMPRTSLTIVEKSVQKRMAKHDLSFENLYRDPDAEIARVLRAGFPHDLEAAFDAAERKVGDAFEEIRPEVVRFDPTLDKPVRAAMGRAQREISQVAQKAYAAHKRKQEETEAQIRRVQLQLFPRGGLQERSLNIVYYWARYGPDFLSRLYAELPAQTRTHLLWEW